MATLKCANAPAATEANRKEEESTLTLAFDCDAAELATIARLVARLKRAKIHVFRLDSGAYLVGRWNQSNYCDDAIELAAYAFWVGV
jgi:hypothetical protein